MGYNIPMEGENINGKNLLKSGAKDKNPDGAAAEEKKKSAAKKQKGREKVHFSWFYYIILMFCSAILKLYFHVKTKKSDAFKKAKRNGAMLVLSNHVSAYDFIYFTTPFFAKKVNFVVAENMMYSRPAFSKLIKGYNAITKKQFYADSQSIKNIKRYLDSGISIVLCPEGKVSAEGRTAPLNETLARFVQWLGYPVATIKINGGGLVRPKWAKENRKGRVFVNCEMLFEDGAVLKKTDKREICERINEALAHDEHRWQAETGEKYRSRRPANGLNRLLYYCPKCGAEFENATENDVLFCKKCGNKVRYAPNGDLIAADAESVSLGRIDVWFDKQKQLVEKETADEHFRLEESVDLFVENNERNGYRYVCRGRLSLDKERMAFVCENNRRAASAKTDDRINRMEYSLNEQSTVEVEEEFRSFSFKLLQGDDIAYNPGDSIDIYDEKHIYRFMFAKRKAATKFALAHASCVGNLHK